MLPGVGMGQLAFSRIPTTTILLLPIHRTTEQLPRATCCRDNLLWVAGGRLGQVSEQVDRAHRVRDGWWGGSGSWEILILTLCCNYCTRLEALCDSGSDSEHGVLLLLPSPHQAHNCCRFNHCAGLAAVINVVMAQGSEPLLMPLVPRLPPLLPPLQSLASSAWSLVQQQRGV